ncbi:MAG: SpoIVB peptidase [Clostridia bacterium]
MINKFKKKISKFREYNKKISLAIFCVFSLLVSYVVLNYSELVAVYNLEKKVSTKIDKMQVILGGDTVGIKLLTTGVLVMGVDRQDCPLKIGDIILKVNGKKVESNAELISFCEKSNGKELNLEVDRHSRIFETKIIPIKDEISQEYKLGIWVKDSSAGVGTVTFYDKASIKFAALGHGVTETKENYILPITTGGLTRTTIYSIKKGVVNSPGELKGSITDDIVGSIETNTEKGIYGKILKSELFENRKEIEILSKSKIKEGKASIFCTLDDNVIKEYKIEIEKVILTSTGNKNMVIRITDEELINKTGGIVQGMSGSPIVQDGKLIGAVTHVFLNDPTRGYGVFIENMIEDLNNLD